MPITFYLYNNTLVNDTTGISLAGNDTKHSANNLFSGVTTATSSGLTTYTKNISSSNVAFANAAANDYHLALTDAVAIDQGTTTPASNAYFPLTADIDDQYRRQYDVGADEASKYFYATVMHTGGDFTNLNSWASSVHTDLTATSTAVFSVNSVTGLFPIGVTMLGETSGATGQLLVFATSSSQALMTNLSAVAFVAGERVDIQGATGNHFNLVNAGNPPIAVAKIDGTWSSPDNSAVTLDTGWGTSEFDYVRIYTTTAARHHGAWTTNAYQLAATSSSSILEIYPSYTQIEGLQIGQGGAGNAIYAHNTNNNITGIQIDKCLIKGSNGSNSGSGIKMSSMTTGKIWNNVVWGSFNYDYDLSGATTSTIYLYNNTASGGNTCYNTDTTLTSTLAINDLAQVCTTGFVGTWVSQSKNNLSSDWTVPGTNSIATSTVNFINASTGDFHMRSGSPAKNAGYYLAADPYLPVTDDFEGDSRYQNFWDIGADQTPPGLTLFRSVGNDPSNLNTVGATVSINLGTATTSLDLPANIGVGDVIQYGSPLQIAFISGRTSSSTYSIQSWNGTYPTATTSATAAIYRAHLHLADWGDANNRTANTSINSAVRHFVTDYGHDLDASSTPLAIACYASSSADTLPVTIDNWITSTSSYIRIFTPVSSSEVGVSQRHNGKWDASKYNLTIADNKGITINLATYNRFLRIEGLQVYISDVNSNYPGQSAIVFPGPGSGPVDIRISANILRGTTTTWDYHSPFDSDETGSLTGSFSIYNNIIYGFKGSANADGFGIEQNGANIYIYNNTIANCSLGIRGGFGYAAALVKNNISYNNYYNNTPENYIGSFDAASTNNISGPNQAGAPGSNPKNNASVLFADPTNNDYHLSFYDTLAKDHGINLSTDPYMPFNTDIDGDTRKDPWDIGADEYTGVYPQYRFQGDFKIQGKAKMD